MTRSILLIGLIALSPLALAKGPDIDKVNGGIRAEAGQEYGDLETVNGGIRIGREAKVESASTVNGGINIGDGATVGEVETVNGGIDIGEGVVITNDAETVNGGIGLARASRVDGSVATVNGRIELDAAEVNQGIKTVNGDVTIGADSTVRGGILVEKPNRGWFSWGKQKKPVITIGRNAIVEGDLVFKQEVELHVHETAKIGRVEGAEAKRFSGDRP